MNDPPKIVILVPAHNEESNIGILVAGLQKLNQHPAAKQPLFDHLLVVDDGSTDRTAAIARQNGARVIPLQKNRGKAVAFFAGAKHARNLGATVLVTLDADLQPPGFAQVKALITPLLEKREKKVDMVLGSVMFDSTNLTGQRAIRMKALEPLFRGNRKWEMLFGIRSAKPIYRVGYGLETALNQTLKNRSVVYVDFQTNRKLGIKTGLGVQHQDIVRARKILKARKKLARHLRKKRTDSAFSIQYLQKKRRQHQSRAR